MNVAQYCNLIGWGQGDLAQHAKINFRTAHKAYTGQSVSRKAARKIAEALSEAIGKRILVGEIDGLFKE